MDSFDHSNKGKVVGLFADEALRDKETPDNHVLWNQLQVRCWNLLSSVLNNLLQMVVRVFVMVEGSQVDWAGHANNLDYLKRDARF